MRNLLALVGLVVVLVVGLGWYLGWYTLGSTQDGHRSVDVDTQKIKDDLKKGVQKVGDVIQSGQKDVEGQPTGLQKNQPNWNVVPQVPSGQLPPPPPVTPLEFHPDGTPKLIPPPPPSFPGPR